ncbi:hypothetical protein QQS21_002470 [Conoideocrella luteorostrata]|uniref:Uncharacterized protein n=1 Tax=Conoideocrella luteorostrata TaxID=1105319 RepID=A0AAJ0G177_9HYPO|nr:hypothetical protein QQS21_002470 [Conoideocrella luteorostrata]
MAFVPAKVTVSSITSLTTTRIVPSIAPFDTRGTDLISNLGPLTTTYTPPSSCSSLKTFGDGLGSHWFTYGYVSKDNEVKSAENCVPSYYQGKLPRGARQVFSPGNACPVGYGPSCTAVASGATIAIAPTVILWDDLKSGETAIACCPSGYGCSLPDIYLCTSTPRTDETITAWIVSSASDSQRPLYTPFPPRYDGVVVVYALPVVYVLAKETAALSLSSSLSSDASQSLSATPSQDASFIAPESTLSRGAIAGIVIGGIIGICLLAATFLLYRRYKANDEEVVDAEILPMDQNQSLYLHGNQPELPGHAVVGKRELGDTGIFELPAGEGGGSQLPPAELMDSLEVNKLGTPTTKKPMRSEEDVRITLGQQ